MLLLCSPSEEKLMINLLSLYFEIVLQECTSPYKHREDDTGLPQGVYNSTSNKHYKKILWTGKGGRGNAGRLEFSERADCLQNKKQVTEGQAQGMTNSSRMTMWSTGHLVKTDCAETGWQHMEENRDLLGFISNM